MNTRKTTYEIKLNNETVSAFDSLRQARREVKSITVPNDGIVEIVSVITVSKVINRYVPQTTTVLVADSLGDLDLDNDEGINAEDI